MFFDKLESILEVCKRNQKRIVIKKQFYEKGNFSFEYFIHVRLRRKI